MGSRNNRHVHLYRCENVHQELVDKAMEVIPGADPRHGSGLGQKVVHACQMIIATSEVWEW